ncbi:hypothetical protein QTP70_012859 [Hemibagrus guttatus]|uniref:Alkylated DNA repair protein AlkB homologue 8 N-terminal domain-containing protein n=1 Tax=Hemibagrus guttatus TaxID=175788 RepID=A0AAE0V0H0_9TELE|nr:hypothetical protein QTP70_012859 [Hemibagrus guttatus]
MSLTKKAQQRMYFLRQLKKFLLPVKMLVNFYTAIIESILTSSITVWFAAATARDKAKLQRVIHSGRQTEARHYRRAPKRDKSTTHSVSSKHSPYSIPNSGDEDNQPHCCSLTEVTVR